MGGSTTATVARHIFIDRDINLGGVRCDPPGDGWEYYIAFASSVTLWGLTKCYHRWVTTGGSYSGRDDPSGGLAHGVHSMVNDNPSHYGRLDEARGVGVGWDAGGIGQFDFGMHV